VSDARVTALAIAPVKGTQLRPVQSVEVGRHGVWENRRFFLVDDQGEMVNATRLGLLNTIVSEYSEDRRHLSLTFPGGGVVQDTVRLGDVVGTRFYGREAPARLVRGDFAAAVSEHVGTALRLVEADDDGGVDRGTVGAVTLISRASLERLASQAERDRVDGRRFRMLIELDGVDPHEEDGWVGREVAIGETRIRGRGHVGRCVITNRHPETGEIDLQTLKILGNYRRDVDTTEPVAFGIFGEVVRPGTIRVGDPVVAP
jgi:uncharacterized protein YcbX